MAEIKDLERGVSYVGGDHDPEKTQPLDLEPGFGRDVKDEETSSSTTVTLAEDDVQEDPNVVFWDGPDDPENPMNWTKWRKITSVATVSLITFITPLASTMFAPGIEQLMVEFKSTNIELGSFVVSVFLLGFAVGPLLLAPASELWGRRILYNFSNLFFILSTVGCALAPNLNFLIGFRFLSGVFGAAPLTIGGGTIADMVPPEKRGLAMSFWTLGPLMGPVVGPAIGGFLSNAEGWRWVLWVIAILSGAISINTLIFLKESHGPTILEAKAARLRKSTANPKLRSKLASTLPTSEVFSRALARPFKMLFMSPIVLCLSIYVAIVYGYLYLLFTTFPTVFEGSYGFSTATVGLSYLGIGVGTFLALVVLGSVSDRIVAAKTLSSGVRKPEYRLIPMAYGSPLMVVGLFWYGWTAYYGVHWIVPIIGTSLIGMGLLLSFIPVQVYMVDAYQQYAASALAASTVLRSVVGATLPLAGPAMYESLGLGWGNSLLGFIALLFLPMPFIFEKYGERLRTKYHVGFE